jgi:hypothetical protein
MRKRRAFGGGVGDGAVLEEALDILKRAQIVSGPPQSPTRSLEVSGSQTDHLTPWYNGRAGITLSRMRQG